MILIIIVGSYSNDFFNKKSDLLNKEISNKKNKIANLNKKILTEKIEYNFLINPEHIKKLSKVLFILIFLISPSLAKDKIDQTIDKTTDFLKSISKKSLNKSQTAEFLNNYAITLQDERNQGEVTYIFDEKNYKRYKDGKVISEDGWRFTNLGKLRVFSGDIKLTWKFKLDKQNVIVIKTKFQPIGKEYPFRYQLKEKFFEQID